MTVVADEFDRAYVLGVQAALFAGSFFPPPTAVALVLVRTDRARARLAADAHETGVVQRVVRHVVGADVGPDVGGGPAGERIEFDDAVIDASKTPRSSCSSGTSVRVML